MLNPHENCCSLKIDHSNAKNTHQTRFNFKSGANAVYFRRKIETLLRLVCHHCSVKRIYSATYFVHENGSPSWMIYVKLKIVPAIRLRWHLVRIVWQSIELIRLLVVCQATLRQWLINFCQHVHNLQHKLHSLHMFIRMFNKLRMLVWRINTICPTNYCELCDCHRLYTISLNLHLLQQQTL